MKVKRNIICTVLCVMHLTFCVGEETTTARYRLSSTTFATETPRPDGTTEGSLEAQLLSEAAAMPESEPTEDSRLYQQAEDNTSAIRKLVDVMNKLVYGTSSERCIGTGANTERLTNAIKEGFTVLVGAVQDLNNTLRHYKDDLSKKIFTEADDSIFEDDGPCPSPFFQAGEDCIYIETERLRYFDAARQACLEMGAKLAEFSNFDPFIAAVNDMDFHENAEIYIGGSDRQREGHWKWLSGKGMSNIPWGYDEPNNLYLEDCIALRASWGKFNDIPCSHKREYVCQWVNWYD